jgi:hypothetical protein
MALEFWVSYFTDRLDFRGGHSTIRSPWIKAQTDTNYPKVEWNFPQGKIGII